MTSEQIRDLVADHLLTPQNCVELVCELQRDWARTATVASFGKLVFGPRDT